MHCVWCGFRRSGSALAFRAQLSPLALSYRLSRSAIPSPAQLSPPRVLLLPLGLCYRLSGLAAASSIVSSIPLSITLGSSSQKSEALQLALALPGYAITSRALSPLGTSTTASRAPPPLELGDTPLWPYRLLGSIVSRAQYLSGSDVTSLSAIALGSAIASRAPSSPRAPLGL